MYLIVYYAGCSRFDACYDETATQATIFQNEVKPLLRGPLQGQNTTCFAFGPTGAGMSGGVLDA